MRGRRKGPARNGASGLHVRGRVKNYGARLRFVRSHRQQKSSREAVASAKSGIAIASVRRYAEHRTSQRAVSGRSTVMSCQESLVSRKSLRRSRTYDGSDSRARIIVICPLMSGGGALPSSARGAICRSAFIQRSIWGAVTPSIRDAMILRSRRFGSPLAMEESPGIVVARSSRSNRASALSTAERRARFEASESENSRAVGQASRSALHSEKAAAPAGPRSEEH